MNASTGKDILSKLKILAPNARATKTIASRIAKRDSMDDARAKVVDKLKANRDYFADPTKARPDSVYKEQADGTFAVGIKYGNRYLDNIADSKPFIEGISNEEVTGVLDALAEFVEEGGCDDAIAKVMKHNRRSSAH